MENHVVRFEHKGADFEATTAVSVRRFRNTFTKNGGKDQCYLRYVFFQNLLDSSQNDSGWEAQHEYTGLGPRNSHIIPRSTFLEFMLVVPMFETFFPSEGIEIFRDGNGRDHKSAVVGKKADIPLGLSLAMFA